MTTPSLFAPYRDILNIPGARAFTVWGLVARLQMGLTGLGTFLLIQIEYDNYGIAGAVVAVQALAWGIVGPNVARLVDRHGQFKVLRVGYAVSVAGRVALIAAALTHQPLWVLWSVVPFMAAAGTQSTYGRARWVKLLRDRDRLNTAFSMESALEEIVFIAGPPTATILAVQVAPWSAAAVAAASVAIGGYMFIAQRSTEPAPRSNKRVPNDVATEAASSPTGAAIAVSASVPTRLRFRRRVGKPLLIERPSLLLLVAMFGASGAMFVSIDASTVAFAEHLGHKQYAGIVLAVFALGSLVGGVIYGARKWTVTLASRLLAGFSFTAVGAVGVYFAPNLLVLGALLFATGLAIAPTMAVGDGATHAAVGTARVTEAMTWTRTGIDLGIAGSAWLTGVLIERHGYAGGFAVSVGAGLIAMLIALASWRYIRSLPYTEDVD